MSLHCTHAREHERQKVEATEKQAHDHKPTIVSSAPALDGSDREEARATPFAEDASTAEAVLTFRHR